MEPKIKIDLLVNHQDLIPVVAQWYLSVFARQGTTIEKCEKALLNRLNTDCLDCCFLAFVENIVVGTVSLTTNDIPNRPTLNPCVTQLFVLEKYRHDGIGQSLVEYAKQKLKDMNFKRTYLYTTNKTIHEWYEKLGWKVIDKDVNNGIEIKIMECEL